VYASCALFTGGEARCWGGSYYTGGVWNGQTAVVLSSDARAVPLGGVATALSRGNGVGHACAVRGDGAILCWGEDGPGVLLGDSAPPPVVPLAGNAKVAQIATSAYHTCVVTDQGKVRCWGAPGNGALGYGNLNPVTSDVAGDVDVGGPAIQVSLGEAHTCALLVGGAVRCWGSGYSHGVPGTNVFDIGDDELPTAYGTIDVGGTVKQIATGNNTTCALLDEGTVKCWGETVSDAALGLGYHFMPDFSVSWVTPALDLGGKAIAIAGGGQHYCAILEGGGLQCWGDGGVGQLGRGNTLDIGDDETPSSVGNVPVGATVVDVALGTETTCVVTTGGGVRCWGRNDQGQCGRSPVDSSIGDDETPASLGDLVFQ
jgi:alpha-tubulin suppressor-like RCC1 family protein